jgi:hypothetical protein
MSVAISASPSWGAKLSERAVGDSRSGDLDSDSGFAKVGFLGRKHNALRCISKYPQSLTLTTSFQPTIADNSTSPDEAGSTIGRSGLNQTIGLGWLARAAVAPKADPWDNWMPRRFDIGHPFLGGTLAETPYEAKC